MVGPDIHVIDLFRDPIFIATRVMTGFSVAKAVGDFHGSRAFHVVNAAANCLWEERSRSRHPNSELPINC